MRPPEVHAGSVPGVRYGLILDVSKPVAEIAADARWMVDAGIDTAAMSQIFGYDALTVLAAVGQQVPDLELMTAVIPTYPRHPLMLAYRCEAQLWPRR